MHPLLPSKALTPSLTAGHYVWYSLELRVAEPAAIATISVECPARRAVAIQLPVSNPRPEPITFRVGYPPDFLGPASLALDAGAAHAQFELFYSPLVAGEVEGRLTFTSPKVRRCGGARQALHDICGRHACFTA